MKLKLRAKLSLSIAAVFLVTYVIIIGYIIINTQNKAIADAKDLANQYALRNANDSKALLAHDLGVAGTMAAAIEQYFQEHDSMRSEAVLRLLLGVVQQDDRYHSTWASLELNALDGGWNKNYGRKRYTVYRSKDSVVDSLNLDGDKAGSLYHNLKLSGKEEITDPYSFSEYSSTNKDDVFGTSVCFPIMRNGAFAGLVGMDIALNNFDFITRIKPYEHSTTFLLANNGTIVAHQNKELIGKTVADIFNSAELEIAGSIREGKFFSFNTNLQDEAVYVTFAPIQLGGSDHPWALGTIVHMDDMTMETDRILTYSIIISITGLIILFLLTGFISGKIIQPVIHTSKLLKELSRGNVDSKLKLAINNQDELGEMAHSLNTLIDSLEQKVQFATSIGENKLDTQIGEIDREDKLGIALEHMRNSLKQNNEQAELRNWFTQGIAEFSEILRFNNDETEDFYFIIIRNLVKYLKANQGGIFLIHEDGGGKKYLELMGTYAFDRKKHLEKKIEIGEGIVGQCVLEADTIYLEQLPENYVRITSGLGDAPPNSVLIVPLKLNSEVLGVVELASFKRFRKHEIEFVEKVGETIASFIFSHNITLRTGKLLEESQKSTEELKAAEEEMRQNIEELEATQEAMHRLHAESQQSELILRAIMEGTEDAVLALNADHKIIALNDEMKHSFKWVKGKLSKGENFLHLLKEDQELWQERCATVFAGQKLSFNSAHTTTPGLVYGCSMTPVHDDRGTVKFALLLMSRKTKESVA
ncbi:GAF domain-containing protein [Cesiribacter sp. SM1]|uniref:GAF domain-containing protein n=1 Tax=Cesiribacter sp. SM1 TaxID=2861196 RepID=UPI001CD50287|nr:GAF domain-containing protein [Cesiribacter sp. SM1]